MAQQLKKDFFAASLKENVKKKSQRLVVVTNKFCFAAKDFFFIFSKFTVVRCTLYTNRDKIKSVSILVFFFYIKLDVLILAQTLVLKRNIGNLFSKKYSCEIF